MRRVTVTVIRDGRPVGTGIWAGEGRQRLGTVDGAYAPPKPPTPPAANLVLDSCNCGPCSEEATRAGEIVAQSLAKLADIEQLQFFVGVPSKDSEGDTVKVTIPLLIKLMEWSRETAKDDKALHEMVEMLYEESQNGSQVLTTSDYTGDIGNFVETQHPRGQPENKGEFVKKGGAVAPKTTAPTKQSVTAGLKQAKVVGGKLWAENGHALPEHIAKLKIPPAWKNVEYNEDPKAKVQVTGLDAAGRKQYVYNSSFSDSQAEAKFARIKELSQQFDVVVQQNDANRNSKDPRTKDCADIMSLIMATGIRPGSEEDTGAKVQAYGATTLLGKHVVQTKTGVALQFIGKKGVKLNIPVADQNLSAMLVQRKAAAGDSGQLFQNVTDKVLRIYAHTLDGGDFKVKDVRTLLGTSLAYQTVSKMQVPKNDVERKKAILEVAKIVSNKLGNTPAVALQSYISPTVFAEWG